MKAATAMHSQLAKRFGACAVALVFATTNCFAAAIPLANAPLVSNTGEPPRPNVYFIFDDSLSMPLEHMPDSSSASGSDCYRNFGYNKIAYNPNVTYAPPPQSNGTQYPNATPTAAREDGFNAASPTTNLLAYTTSYAYGSSVSITSTAFQTSNGTRNVTVTRNGHGLTNGTVVRFLNTPTSGTLNGIPWSNITWTSGTPRTFAIFSVTANTFRFTADGSTNATNNNTGGSSGDSYSTVTATNTGDVYYSSYTANPTSPVSTCASDASYTRVRIYAQSATQQQNYANWYSFYSNRLLLMKSASGIAFSSVTDKYRVGFSTTSETGTDASEFLGNQAFTGTHRTAWYNMLYGTAGDFAGTPLRGALSKAGRYYAGKLTGAAAGTDTDPVQYSCQRNFTILTTDGFWNTFGENTGSGTKYGPYKEDNTSLVGDQDTASTVARPYRDDPTATHTNTLADVSYYFYDTDLRSTALSNGTGGLTDEGALTPSLTDDHVSVVGSGAYVRQNMFTFTLGLGVTDSLSYPSDLPPVGSAGRDTSPIMQGTKNWPNPDVTNGGITVAGRTDDLWHAAENGRGRYISASNADTVVTGLNAALAAIESQVGSSAAAATSTLEPVAGNNTAFIAQFETVTWLGNLVARSIDVATGSLTGAPLWQSKLVINTQYATSAATRPIYTFDSTDAGDYLRDFRFANLTLAEQAWFDPSTLSQAPTWTLAESALASSASLVDYLRGEPALEGTVYRDRAYILGDIVNAAPVFVGKPPFSYLDTGYATFITDNASRPATVYVGANDGMLHAINAANGQERWAYMPSMVLPNLKALADDNYSSNHRFYVDGPIVIGDAYDTSASEWKTVLVGGLGAGGKGYYALDVTDPANPEALWEFGVAEDGTGDADMGYSYGNAMITKRQDNRWVVIFASGYNNSAPGGDARGRMYVVDAITGQKLDEYITSTTNDEDLSGIGRAANLSPNSLQDNTTQYVYAGDLRGSLWRFDISADSGATAGYPSTGVVQLGRTKLLPGVQPITVRPQLARVTEGAATYTVVYFGTGRFLGPQDLGDPSDAIPDHTSTDDVQAIYAVKDTGAFLGTFSSGAGLVQQVMTVNTPPLAPGQKEREVTSLQPLDWSSDNGWFVEVPLGERFNINPNLQVGVLVIPANIVITADRDRCNPKGAAVLYQIDYRTGNILKSGNVASMIVGVTTMRVGTSASNLYVTADGNVGTDSGPPVPPVGGPATRISWRELE